MELEKRLQEHLKDPRHKDLLEQILEWQSRDGVKEVERRLLEMVERILGPGDEND
ncbi:hypothetical protein [[Eubacterium] cellulosolvens]